MKLKDFIRTVLVDIDAGIQEAADQTKRHIWLQDSEGTKRKDIEFDVAITANSEASGKAGAEISVVSLASIGAKANAKIMRN